MNVGILCYPSVGGSGIVATELGKQLARRGHRVHIFSSDQPFRLTETVANLHFHLVTTPLYPLFQHHPPYILTLANKVVEVSRREKLDILHAHYAVPHAVAAYLAREMLGGGAGPRVVTTLHGTDITLLGDDPSFADAIAFSINASDGVTAVSRFLARETYRTLPAVRAEIEHIPNFLDCGTYDRRQVPGLRQSWARPQEKVVVHMSNFRHIKRVDNVVRIFARIAEAVPATLLLVGDGPEAPTVAGLANQLGVGARVQFLGNQLEVVPILSTADLFLLPSESESFGLSAAEAMACGTPVVASDVAGLPEVVEDGVSGFLLPPHDVDGMARAALTILRNPDLQRRMGESGRKRIHSQFCAGCIVPRYEAYYSKVLAH